MTIAIKGQEVKIFIVRDGIVETELNKINSMTIEVVSELIFNQYLGQVADEVDEIYHHMKGSINLHFNNRAAFDFKRALIERKQRRRSNMIINIAALYSFTDGTQVSGTLFDCKFESIPENIGGRAQHVAIDLSFATGKEIAYEDVA